MSTYSTEFKAQIVKKMMPPNNQSVAHISRESGIHVSTLYSWKKQFQAKGFVVPAKPSSPDRWDAKAKLAAIIQTASMNESERSAYCREHGIYPEQLDAWKAAFEAVDVTEGPVTKAVLAAERKKSRQLEKELRRKEKALAETAALLTLSKKSPGYLGHQRGRLIPLSMKQIAITLIQEAVDAGARRHMACALMGISCRTLLRWQAAGQDLADKRRDTAKRVYAHALSEEERREILNVCNLPEHQSLPPTQIVPKLADNGIYIASESSFYRVLKAHGQLNHRGRTQQARQVAKPKALAATAPNQVWSWDITYLPSAVRGQFYRLYILIDIFSRLITGWEVHLEESSQHAATLIDKACLKHRVPKGQLVLHSDNGSPMKGATMLATLQRLGIMPSFSRPSVSDDNPYSESLFKTLKYTPAYPSKPFADITQARQWVQQFVTWYNTEHCHSGIQFVTPEQRHTGEDKVILAQRSSVYEVAKAARPERWKNRSTRNWQPVETVWLNPSKASEELEKNIELAA